MAVDRLILPLAESAGVAVPNLDELIARLQPRPRVEELLGGFVPPARFADKSFESYTPAHPSQEAAEVRLRRLAGELQEKAVSGLSARLRRRLRGPERGSGVYLDGGFGVGKTHLLASLWHAAPYPKAYLSFDELVHFIGLVGVEEARRGFATQRLAAVDEWELDDPGNLKLALAFLRGALADGLRVIVTSNTLPLELGAGRFNQKDFVAEIEELSSAFEVVRIEGEDYRHRHFEADPGREYFLSDERLGARAAEVGDGALHVGFEDLLVALPRVHPIRYAALVDPVTAVFVSGVRPVTALPDALRWVRLIDVLYDAAVPFRASGQLALGSLFAADTLRGPFGKKLSRCLSRMEEMLGEAVTARLPL